ncbi:putative GPI-anchored protein pfl2 isoform X2 [Lucilia sericata]|uniref:putative GPI-anchored protein pfl2 isoform X2 n=1 Tax=Lucilia sericata TaxID=13632 RepID=UPI0018A83B7A|nr:putative GPI-anchored protein pfl2 isoform X2 [Lucilia sericata]
MLPPPITTPTIMNDDVTNNNTKSLATQRKQHHQSALFSNTSFASSSSSSSSATAHKAADISTSTNSFPTIPFNTTSIKNFFNKTLAHVAKTNLSDYTAQYTSSFSNSAPDSASAAISHALDSQVYDGLIGGKTSAGGGSVSSGGVIEQANTFDGYAAAADMAVSSLSNGSHHLETTTAFPTAQTVATFIAGNKNRATTIIVYPTVSPESIVIPIVSCIFGFPILAFIVICCLRHRAKLARERDRRRNYDMQDHAVSLVRFSPIHRLNYRSSRAISLRPERSLSQGFTSLELDTVVEERCSDVEQTQTEILNPDSPMESSTTSYKMSFSSS